MQAENKRVADTLAAEEAEKQAAEKEAEAVAKERDVKSKQHIIKQSSELRDLHQYIHVRGRSRPSKKIISISVCAT